MPIFWICWYINIAIKPVIINLSRSFLVFLQIFNKYKSNSKIIINKITLGIKPKAEANVAKIKSVWLSG